MVVKTTLVSYTGIIMIDLENCTILYVMRAHVQVLLDPSTMKGSNKEWKDLKKQLDNAGKLKVGQNCQLNPR